MDKENFINRAEAVNLRRLHDWACYTEGARMMLLRLRQAQLTIEEHITGGKNNIKDKLKITSDMKIYNKAILDLILSDKDNVARFLMEEYDIRFTDHRRDSKGKLVKCRAYFAEKITKYVEL